MPSGIGCTSDFDRMKIHLLASAIAVGRTVLVCLFETRCHGLVQYHALAIPLLESCRSARLQELTH